MSPFRWNGSYIYISNIFTPGYCEQIHLESTWFASKIQIRCREFGSQPCSETAAQSPQRSAQLRNIKIESSTTKPISFSSSHLTILLHLMWDLSHLHRYLFVTRVTAQQSPWSTSGRPLADTTTPGNMRSAGEKLVRCVLWDTQMQTSKQVLTCSTR